MPRAALVGVLMCLLLSCGGTEPNPGNDDPDPDPGPGPVPVDPGDAVGLWDAALTGIGDLHGNNPVPGHCAAEWVMSIVKEPFGSDTLLSMTIPFTARFHCADGRDIPWFEGSRRFGVDQTGDSVAFFDQRSDSFMVARFTARNKLEGRSAGGYYPAASFSAVRRLSPVDPNLAPYLMEILPDLDSIEVGDSTAVRVYALNAYGGQVLDPGVEWSSSDTDIATVSENGMVVAVAPGTVTVRGTLGSLADTVDLHVLTPPASVEITQVPDSLIVPANHALVGVARDGGGQVLPGRRFHWTSSDPSIGTVVEFAAEGWLTAVNAGTVAITARSTTVSATVVVTVLAGVAEIVVTGTDGTVPIGGAVQLTATTHDSASNVLTGRPVFWQAELADRMSVDQNGRVTAHQGGPSVVTVRAESVVQSLKLVATMDAPLAAITAGWGHTCGLTATGRIYCWGYGGEGRLGPDFVDRGATVVPVAAGRTFATLSAGAFHTCALDQAGRAFCWGANGSGELGHSSAAVGEIGPVIGGSTSPGSPSATPSAVGSRLVGTLIAGGPTAWASSAGGAATPRPISTDGPVYCWGDIWLQPTQLDASSGYVRLIAGSQHYCRLDAAGSMSCWGTSENFQDYNLDYTPSQPIADFAAGLVHTCALPVNGKAICWGLNDVWQLGVLDEFGFGPVQVWGQP